jgi:hypothetical protein
MAAEVEPKGPGLIKNWEANGENFKEHERMRLQAIRLTNKMGNETISISVMK